MDLRDFPISRQQASEAFRLLAYQPFIIDEDRHVGVADSWLYDPEPTQIDRERNRFRFDRQTCGDERYEQAARANRQLAATYDSFAAAIAEVAGSGSYLDFSCNSGYMPVRASLLGIRESWGCDWGDFSNQIALLNQITGSSARFIRCQYDSTTHRAIFLSPPPRDKFDVVSSMSFLCHVPDPLHFLAALSRLATKAVFLWTGLIESEELLIRYNPPQVFNQTAFPNGFDSGTAISTALLKLSMRQCGFPNCRELPWQPSWLPADWTKARMAEYQTFKPLLFLR